MALISALLVSVVENETHCDFIQLREMLIRTNMEDLRERTHNTHYERYRKKALANMGYLSHDGSDQPVRLVSCAFMALVGLTPPSLL